MTSTSAPCHLLVRSKAGLELFTVPERPNDALPPQRSNPFLLQGVVTTLAETSPDGSAVYVHVAGTGIVKCDLSANSDSPTITKETCRAFLSESLNVQLLDLSPSGRFLLTWERWYAESCPNNLKVWEAATGKLLASFPQKALSRDAWPYLQWTSDEEYAFLLATNEVRIFPRENFFSDEVRYTDKLRISSIKSISLPQTSTVDEDNNKSKLAGYYFTSFCPGTKAKPARAALHAYQPNATTSTSNPYPALLSKSLFQAEEMKTHWNPLNDTALITLQTSVDASGQSYYGSSQLFLLNAAANKDVLAVPLPQEGPVLDVQWMPNPGKPPCFVVVAGRMPSMASLHHGLTGQALFLFGHAHRNTCVWAPHGRFLCLAGFGNLAGGMGFWDRNKEKLIPGSSLNASGQLQAEAVVGYGWSPDSRLFVVSTCTPRMNVDNGIRLFTYAGQEFSNVPWSQDAYRPDKLFEATFVPAKRTVYPDRPQTPPPEGTSTTPAAAAAAAATAPAPVAPKPAGRYVPPSARGKGGNSLAERLQKEREGTLVGATKVTSKAGAAMVRPKPTVVGMAAEAPATKSKSALRREKAKQQKKQQQQILATVETTVEAPAVVDSEKRARKLRKTLKQIDDLKTKDPGSLNEDQRKKIASEEQVRKELSELGLS